MKSLLTLREKLAQGQPVLGMWSVLPSAGNAEILGYAGMDFVILDMEHGPYDMRSVEEGIRACEVTGCAALVRVPGVVSAELQPVLDLGAQGIVFPRVASIADAEHAVQSVHFPPTGTRGMNPFTRAFQYDPSGTPLQPLSCVIVEDAGAVHDIDAILALPGLDMVYIGVYDLAVSLGHGSDVQHADVVSVTDMLRKKIVESHKVCGLMVRSEQELIAALQSGVKMIVWATDSALIRSAAHSVRESFDAAKQRSIS